MEKFMQWLKKTYQAFVDHLTKVLGGIGASLMSVMAWIDPDAIRIAAQTYLGEHAVEKVGAFLFALVIVRGWFTGRKAAAMTPPVMPPAV